MRILLIIIAFVLCSDAPAYSQKDCGKRIPFFRTLRANKLAVRLTRNLNSDEEKVFAIHCWMTHHIKYDVHKWLSFDNSKTPVNRILRKRKAICSGYSDLFNELCRYAQVRSTYIPGYSKGPMTDLFDKFYIPEHVWNAVYLNNQWKLIDVTWDAGYIKYTRRTFLGFFIHLFSFGKKDQIKFKPHFKQAPTNMFYCRSGNFFKTDHTPEDPIWQLTEEKMSVTDCEKDSSFYLKRYDLTPAYPDSNIEEAERMSAAVVIPEDRMIVEGFSSHHFNHKNHFSIGRSFLILSKRDVDALDLKTTDTISMLKQCDTTENKLKTGIMHFDSNAYYLAIQKEELNLNNNKKKRIMLVQNKRLVESTHKVLDCLRAGMKYCKAGIKKSEKFQLKNELYQKRLHSKTRFRLTKHARKPNPPDSLNTVKRIAVWTDSIRLINESFSKKFKLIDTLHILSLDKIHQYSEKSFANTATADILADIRFSFYDDLDYEFRQVMDTLLSHKFKDDSIIIYDEKGFVVKIFYNEFIQLKKDLKQLYTYHKALADEYAKLKKACVKENNLKSEYKSNLKNYDRELRDLNRKLNNCEDNFDEVRFACKMQAKLTGKELKGYGFEKRAELILYAFRKGYIRRNYKSLLGISRVDKKICTSLLKTVNKTKKLYKRSKV